MEHHHAHETAAWRSESQRELSHAWDLNMAAAFALCSATVVTHGVVTRRRRLATIQQQQDNPAGDDSAYEAADDVERAALVSGASSLALNNLVGCCDGQKAPPPQKVPTHRRKFPTAQPTLAARVYHALVTTLVTIPYIVQLVDVALFASIAWGVMYVGHDWLCGAVMRCECTFPWRGGWARCNAHNAMGGPRCPWCTAPYWVSVLTQKSCAAVMIAAYAVGFGAPSSDPSRALAANHETADVCQPCVPVASPSSAPLLFTVARCCIPGSKREMNRGRCGTTKEKEEDEGASERSGTSGREDEDVTSSASVLLRRIVAACIVWFCVEMFWQAFFWLTLGTKQDPTYPCFVFCWDSPKVPGNNPPSPLSMADAPPMRRLYDDVVGSVG